MDCICSYYAYLILFNCLEIPFAALDMIPQLVIIIVLYGFPVFVPNSSSYEMFKVQTVNMNRQRNIPMCSVYLINI